MRVGLFIPCFVDQFSLKIGLAMVKMLKRLNFEVDFPTVQTCYGWSTLHTGYRDETRQLAKRHP
jgi:L-lactate dehydrogenase complex protein LldE